jgi:hypothetical protein
VLMLLGRLAEPLMIMMRIVTMTMKEIPYGRIPPMNRRTRKVRKSVRTLARSMRCRKLFPILFWTGYDTYGYPHCCL